MASPPRTSGKPFAAGDLVADRYRLVSFLGAGGMGEVFAAEDTVVGGPVALKTLTVAVADDPDALARMKREVQLARLITHPNVCRLHDLGFHRDASSAPVAFLTMELVAGESLGQRIRRVGRIESARAARLVSQMVIALEAAHKAGVTHRDFKSDNVLLEEAPGIERVVVADFGLAHCVLTPSCDPSTITGRVMIGTAAYMAPEVVEGAAVSVAVDYYALGIVIFEMLTAALPFVGPSPIATAARRLIQPPPPLRRHVPDIDPRWERIVSGCLQRDPQHRLAFVHSKLRPALQELLDCEGAPSLVRRSNTRRRSRQARSKRVETASLHSLPAKLTPPALSTVCRRSRLFELLDDALRLPVVWIEGPPGAGKTTLVSSYVQERKLPRLWYQVDAGDADPATFFHYLSIAARQAAPRTGRELPHLTPECLPNLSLFSRRYFEELCTRLRPPAVIVLDSYQDAGDETCLHSIVADAVPSLTAGFQFLILSRSAPPATLARARASGQLAHIGWAELKLTEAESREIARSRIPTLTEGALSAMYSQTQGWAAGLVLALERGRQITDERIVSTPQAVFDYFAAELFDRMEPLSQSVLLDCAFLPHVTPSRAERLTGHPRSGHVFAELNARGYFVVKHSSGSYQLHPLFREFLLTRALATRDEQALATLQRNAALLLESEGEEAEAVSLLADAKAWDELAATIQRHAHTLLQQGRAQTLDTWLKAFPEERLDHEPWLLYFLALCRMSRSPQEARSLLQTSFQLFGSRNDANGLYLAWAALVDTFVCEQSDVHPLDHCVSELEQALQRHPAFPSPDIEARVANGMLNALIWRQSWHPRFSRWAEHAMTIMLSSDNGPLRLTLGTSLLMYHVWTGAHAKASLLIDTLGPMIRAATNDPLASHMWFFMCAMHAWHRADHEGALSAVSQSIALGEQTGVRLLEYTVCAHGVISALSTGDHATADDLFARIAPLIDSPRKLDRALYHLVAASSAWYRGELKTSAEYGRQAVRLTDECGFPLSQALSRIELSVTLFDLGRTEEADEELDRAFVVSAGLTHLEFLCRLFRSWFSLERGDRDRGVACLREALAIAAKEDYVNHSRWRPQTMSKLCAVALEHAIEPAYVRRLIAFRRLTPPANLNMAVCAWPRPLGTPTR